MYFITIALAGIRIGIRCNYVYTVKTCQPYAVQGEPEFTVSATHEEIAAEAARSDSLACKAEGICVYRRIAQRLPEYQAFVMHGAVMQAGEKAYMFTAPSGTGKTTHIRLWEKVYGERVSVLNGDKPILRLLDGTFYACGTPWKGKEGYGKNERLPLAGLCFLTRGAQNEIRRVGAGEALVMAMKQIYLQPEPEQQAAFLALYDRFLMQTPLYMLQCNTEESAATVSYEAMCRN